MWPTKYTETSDFVASVVTTALIIAMNAIGPLNSGVSGTFFTMKTMFAKNIIALITAIKIFSFWFIHIYHSTTTVKVKFLR